jgi:hypothetical protein
MHIAYVVFIVLACIAGLVWLGYLLAGHSAHRG